MMLTPLLPLKIRVFRRLRTITVRDLLFSWVGSTMISPLLRTRIVFKKTIAVTNLAPSWGGQYQVSNEGAPQAEVDSSERSVVFVGGQYNDRSSVPNTINNEKDDSSHKSGAFVGGQYQVTDKGSPQAEDYSSERSVVFVGGQYNDRSPVLNERDNIQQTVDNSSEKSIAFVGGQYNDDPSSPNKNMQLRETEDDSSGKFGAFVGGQYCVPSGQGKSIEDDGVSEQSSAFVGEQYNVKSPVLNKDDCQKTKDDSCEKSDDFVDKQYAACYEKDGEGSERSGAFVGGQYNINSHTSKKDVLESANNISPKSENERVFIGGQYEQDPVDSTTDKSILSMVAPARDLKIGNVVEANYGEHGHWYLGKISKIDMNGLYGVSYDDGDYEEEIALENIRFVADDAPLAEARPDFPLSEPERDFNNASNRTHWEDDFSRKIVVRSEPVQETVVENLVPLLELALVPEQKPFEIIQTPERVNLFAVGDSIISNFANQGQWCPGTISASKPNGLYDVVYTDGDIETDKKEHFIMEIPDGSTSMAKYSYVIGDKILCNYKNKGLWFEGEISSFKGGGDFVLFDILYVDGDMEYDVAAVNVIPRPGVEEMSSEPMLQIQGSSFNPIISNHLEGGQYRRISQKIINAIKPFHHRTKRKSDVIHRKHIVMRHLYTKSFLRDYEWSPDQPFVPTTLEHIAIKPMEDAHARRIPLSPSKVMLLKMMRRRLDDAKMLYQRTTSGIEKCKFMAECKSIFHYKLSGCPKCGVIFISDVMHLNSFDRATMAPIITTREFEMEILSREIGTYKSEFENRLEKLRQYEATVRESVVFDIQAWWASRIAWRKAKKQHDLMIDSLYRFRLRRLVKMKKAIDKFNSAKQKMTDLEDSFCDIIPEMKEYRLYKKAKVQRIVKRWGFKVLEKTRNRLRKTLWREERLARLREEERLERQLRRAEEVEVAEEIRKDLRAIAEEIANKVWTCPRFECNRRKFLSKGRFDTHMKVHRHLDVEVEAARREVYLRKMRRLNEEEDIIRQIRAVKAGVLEMGGDLERDGNPTLKYQRVVAGSRPYMLVKQYPGEYREDQIRAMEKERLRLLEEERLRSAREAMENTVVVEEEEEVVDTSMDGRHEEAGINDIMKELEVVTNFGAKLKMFEKSNHVVPQDVVDPFEEQARLEREAEEKRIAHEKLHGHLLETSCIMVEGQLLEEACLNAFFAGYNELPPLLPLGYKRLTPPSSREMSQAQPVGHGNKKIEREFPCPEQSLVLFDKTGYDETIPPPLPPVNQADLQCRHDSDLNYEITYRIKTGKRYSDKRVTDDHILSFSNITNKPNPKPRMSKSGTFGNELVIYNPSEASDEALPQLLLKSKSVGTTSSRMGDGDRDSVLSLRKLGSAYIEKQLKERRFKEPDWMLMQHRLRLNDSIHTQKFVTFEIVSMAKTIELSDTEFIMNKPIMRFGTLDACDYTIKCTNNVGGDIRKERALSKIHCMVYVPLISSEVSKHDSSHSKKLPSKKEKQFARSYDSDSEEDSDDEAERRHSEKMANSVTIVDNHSCWGTYVVTQHGVKKVPTTIQAGIPLEHGDLVCMGITRNGPTVMTAIEANRALIVFRVRTDYCATIGKVPEFNVGEMILAEQEKAETVDAE